MRPVPIGKPEICFAVSNHAVENGFDRDLGKIQGEAAAWRGDAARRKHLVIRFDPEARQRIAIERLRVGDGAVGHQRINVGESARG